MLGLEHERFTFENTSLPLLGQGPFLFCLKEADIHSDESILSKAMYLARLLICAEDYAVVVHDYDPIIGVFKERSQHCFRFVQFLCSLLHQMLELGGIFSELFFI